MYEPLKLNFMRTVDVIILKGGRTAKEINPLGEKPWRSIRMKYMTKDLKASFNKATKEWREAEKKRRTFEIDFSYEKKIDNLESKRIGKKVTTIAFIPNSHRKAQLLHNAKIKIL